MDEDKLGRAISLFLFCLFGAATSQVPHHDATIGAARGQEVALVTAEFNLVDLITMLS